jgi:fructose-specific phosphotransferase system IIA component
VALEIAANIACSEEAGLAFQHGADAIGLFRTEMLYMDRQAPPDEQEQVAAYRDVLSAAHDRPVIFRTLDIGGDKDVPYLNLDREDNPLLGHRGIRLYRTHEVLFRTQLRALLQAAQQGRPWIMVPMVSALEEVLWVKSILDQVRAELAGAHGSGIANPPLGAMVETPAAALIVDQLCQELDFLSIGTNDLIQYLLAVDRTNGQVRPLYDGHHPSVIQAIRQIVDGAHRHGRWVGACGEMAADPVNLPLWLGLGVDEISVTPTAVGPLKAEVRGCSASHAKALVTGLTGCRTAAEVTDRLVAWRRHKDGFDLVDPRMIGVDVKVPDKTHAIKALVDRLYVEDRTDDPVAVENALWQREAAYSTGLGYGFAVPHCQTPALAADTIGVLKLATPVDWNALDGRPVSVVILLALRNGSDRAHLQVFADLSRCLVREEFRRTLLETHDPGQIVRYLREQLHMGPQPP